MENNNTSLLNLQEKLKEIFEINNSDLDFGIYRIMKFREKEIKNFIDIELPKTIDSKFKSLESSSKNISQKVLEFEEASENDSLVELYNSWNTTEIESALKYNPKFKEYVSNKNSLKDSKKTSIESDDIYNWLNAFFTSYYDKWDFFKTRKQKWTYKFEWWDVGFTWATEWQYYIKSWKHFNMYSFLLSDDKKTKITFELLETKEAINNNKDKCKLIFGWTKNIIDEETWEIIESFTDIQIKDNEIILFFEYKEWENKNNTENILEVFSKSPFAILTKYLSDKKTEKTKVLDYHLTRFEAESKRDFFIHKDLKWFLNTELEDFINRVISEKQQAILWNVWLATEILKKLQVMREVSITIIDFIAWVEEYQKAIFEKKKFVVESEYCMTLDKISSDFYDEISKNKEQVEELKKLWFIDEKTKLDKTYLEQNQTLVLDTKFFPNLKSKILASFENLDEETNGLLINSENFQALNFMLEKYRWKVKCIYIDPPFNLWQNWDFYYKTNYLNSSWCSLLEDRLLLAKEFLSDDWSIFVRCDYHWNFLVRQILNKIFWEENFMNELIVWKSNRIKTKWNKYLSWYDNIFYYANNINKIHFNHLTKKSTNDWWRWMDKPWEVWTVIPDDLLKYFSKENIKYDEQWNAISRAKIILWKECLPPNNARYPSQETIKKMEEEWRIKLNWNWTPQMKRPEDVYLTDNWTDLFWYANTTWFNTENSEVLLKRVIETSTNKWDIVMDFFVWSATTQATAHKLERKWLWSEMWDYFYNYPFKRLKNVLFWVQKWISKEKDVSYKWWWIFEYKKLEQYEDSLNNLQEPQKIENQGFLNTELWKIVYELKNNETSSISILNDDSFIRTPFAQSMKIWEDDFKKVNFVDTFNYLLWIHVEKYLISEDNKQVIISWNKELSNWKIVKYFIVWFDSKNDVNSRFEKVVNDYKNLIEKADFIYCNHQIANKEYATKDIYPEFYELTFKSSK